MHAVRRLAVSGSRRFASPLFLDQMASSGSNVLLVLVAARAMEADQFAVFATLQLVNTALMGVGRLAVYGPALSTQRSIGRLRIPAIWVPYVCVLLAALSSPVTAWVLARDARASPLEIALICMAPVLVFAQDGLRYVRMSESRIKIVLASDLAWLCLSVPLVAFQGGSVARAYFAWILGALLALILLLPSKTCGLPAASFDNAWRVGRWGLADSLIAAFVLAGPTVAAGVYSQSLVPEYRVIQSAVSPMNLFNSVLVVSFGLGAWQLRERGARVKLQTRVRKATISLMTLAAALSTLGIGVGLWFARLNLEQAWGPWLVVASATMVGAWMSARQAASQSLGMQHYGAVTRLVSGLFTAGVMVLSVRAFRLDDPIGVTIVGTTMISLVGSQLSFSRGLAQLRDGEVVESGRVNADMTRSD